MSFSVAVNGILIPIMMGTGLDNLTITEAEVRFVSLLKQLCQMKSGAIIDIGANLGRFLLYLLHFDRRRSYVGFDVHIACARYVQELIRLNELKAHLMFPIGLSNHAHIMVLQMNDQTDVSATLVDGVYPSDRFTLKKPVWVEAGDRILSDLALGPISLMKIDVEGGEVDVLRGMQATLRLHNPFLIVEVFPPLASNQQSVQECRRARNQALTDFSLVSDGQTRIQPASVRKRPGQMTGFHNTRFSPLRIQSIHFHRKPHAACMMVRGPVESTWRRCAD